MPRRIHARISAANSPWHSWLAYDSCHFLVVREGTLKGGYVAHKEEGELKVRCRLLATVYFKIHDPACGMREAHICGSSMLYSIISNAGNHPGLRL